MSYKLAIDWDVYQETKLLGLTTRRLFERSFSRIQGASHNNSARTERGLEGQRWEVHPLPGYEIVYWIDEADKRVLIVGIRRVPIKRIRRRK
jgi:hypothetical protein